MLKSQGNNIGRELVKLFGSLNSARQQGYTYTMFPTYNWRYLSIVVSLLLKEGILDSFYSLNSVDLDFFLNKRFRRYFQIMSFVFLWFRFIGNFYMLKNFKIYWSIHKKIVVDTFYLKFLVNLYPNSCFYLYTSYGLISHREALFLNVGGLLLFSLF